MQPAFTSAAQFKECVTTIEARPDYIRPRAFGLGLGHLDSHGNLLDVWYPYPNHNANFGTAAILAHVLGYSNGYMAKCMSPTSAILTLEDLLVYFAPFSADLDQHPNVRVIKMLERLFGTFIETQRGRPHTDVLVVCFIPPAEIDEGPQDVADAYLRLHLLSHRLVRPHGIRLDNVFGILPNVVWTTQGPVSRDDLEDRQFLCAAKRQPLHVLSVDRFPRMLDYVVPSGVRITNAANVRLGAYLGDGTTVMTAGAINFNAGTEGPNMIEGRISAGVFVGAGSDLGGGCSIMGTLSGGGKEVVSIGRGCLIGANGGTGISLGDGCTIEAGLYVTAGLKVRLTDGTTVKARSLSGQSDMLFRRSSTTGGVEMIKKTNTTDLNPALHKN
jgi:2,3,4,5-tetrahydropyridine-2-carboxylate N-succinyltransferase